MTCHIIYHLSQAKQLVIYPISPLLHKALELSPPPSETQVFKETTQMMRTKPIPHTN